MNNKQNIIKKNIPYIIIAAAFLLGMILLYSGTKAESFGGFLVTVSVVALPICILLKIKSRHKKREASPAPATINNEYKGIVFPETYNENGKSYERRYDYEYVEVVGTDYCGNKELAYGETVQAIQEPTNPVDPEAVALCIMRAGTAVKFGYLPCENRLKSMVNDFYRKGGTVLAAVDNPKRYTISMAFYYEQK